MQINLTTPALLFSTISLLLLAYTNRFLGLANIIRKLHELHTASPNDIYVDQIENLRRRIKLIRDMQILGVLSLLMCTICMFVLFLGLQWVGKAIFVCSLLCMVISLGMSILEIRISVGALDLQLKGMHRSSDRVS